jgi:hypothetical protein
MAVDYFPIELSTDPPRPSHQIETFNNVWHQKSDFSSRFSHSVGRVLETRLAAGNDSKRLRLFVPPKTYAIIHATGEEEAISEEDEEVE